MTGSKINPHATRTHCDSLDSIIAPQSIAWRQIAPEPTWLCPSGLWLEGHNQVLQVPGSQTTWYILVWFGIICYIIKHHFPTFVAKIHQNPCFFLWRSQAWLTFESHGRSGHSTVAGHRRNRRGPRISHSMQKVNWSIPVFPTWQFSYSIIPNMAIRWKKWWKRLEKCFLSSFIKMVFETELWGPTIPDFVPGVPCIGIGTPHIPKTILPCFAPPGGGSPLLCPLQKHGRFWRCTIGWLKKTRR